MHAYRLLQLISSIPIDSTRHDENFYINFAHFGYDKGERAWKLPSDLNHL